MPNSLSAVLIIALLIAPGYITLSIIKRRTRQFLIKSDVEFVVATIAVGILVQAVAFVWPGRQVVSDYSDSTVDHEWQLVAWLIALLVLVPLFIGGLGSSAIQKYGDRLSIVGLDQATRTSRAWHAAVERDESVYARVWLVGSPERVIGGKYSTESLASMEPDYQDIFLEEVWELDEDNWFVQPSPDSAGVWLSPGAISHIEFTREQNPDEQEQQTQ